MRFRVALLTCGLFVLSGLIFGVYERNRYNIVSYKELLAIREKLKVLSQQEREDLAFFIGETALFDQYPYTLVGYKPMSISTVIVDDTEGLPQFREVSKRPRHQRLRRGYLVWEKYQSIFSREKHLFVNYSFLGKGRKEIALIYPKLCMTTIRENLNDFREVLRRPCTSEEVFWILTHPEHNDFYTLIDHTRLMGILLGFGRNNACLYEQYRGGASRSDTGHRGSEKDPLQMFSDQWPWPGMQLSPDFACDPKLEETQRLKKHYKQAHKIVYWTYFFRNPLEVTLALLMQC